MHQCAPAVQGLFLSVGQLNSLQSAWNCSLFAICFAGRFTASRQMEVEYPTEKEIPTEMH